MTSSRSTRPPARGGADEAPAVLNHRYHHGDLKRALIDAGLAALERTPAETLSLRALARELGVSPTAVYRHLADKQALLAALAQAGFQQFEIMQAQSMSGLQDPVEIRRAAARAYINFARRHPALFELMFSRLLLSPAYSELHQASMSAFAQLLNWAAPHAGAQPGSQAGLMAALARWSFVHGLSRLILDGPLEAFGADMDALINALLNLPGF